MPESPIDPEHPQGIDQDLEESLDPAQQALSDALRVSFMLLKVAMACVFVAYLFSGVYRVKGQEVAVRLRFGHIGQNPEDSILKQSGIGLPFPFDEIVKVPNTDRRIKLDTQFWFELTEALRTTPLDKIPPTAGGPLDPEDDGFMITGDVSIVHAKWGITYRVKDPINYVLNVGKLDLADKIVRNVAEQSVVHAVAQVGADQFIKDKPVQAALAQSREVLDQMQSGLEITMITVEESTVPILIRQHFDAVNLALNAKGQEVSKAVRERDDILGGTAGEAWPVLQAKMQEYELARLAGTQEAAAKVLEEFDAMFTDLNTGPDHDNLQVGGDVARLINEGLTYRTQVVEQTRTEAETFDSLYGEYKKNPRLFMELLEVETFAKIMEGNLMEVIYVQEGTEIRLRIAGDSALRKKLEEQWMADQKKKRDEDRLRRLREGR